jgi:hypothetical protein
LTTRHVDEIEALKEFELNVNWAAGSVANAFITNQQGSATDRLRHLPPPKASRPTLTDGAAL